MRLERGLSEETIKTRCWYVKDFLQWFVSKDRPLSDIAIADIDEAIAEKAEMTATPDCLFRCMLPAFAISSATRRGRAGADEGWPI